MNYKIYEYICPLSTQEYPFNVRYVGKTSLNIYKRLVQHLSDDCRCRTDKTVNQPKVQWTNNLVEKGLFPIVNCVLDNLQRQDAIIQERKRIEELIKLEVPLFNITYNPNMENPRVRDSRKRKSLSTKRKVYVFDLDFALMRTFQNIEEVCTYLNISKAMFHLCNKYKYIINHQWFVSYTKELSIGDVDQHSYRNNKISCWSIKTKTRTKYFSGGIQATQELDLKPNSIKTIITKGKVVQNKYLLTYGDDIPIFKPLYKVFKDEKLICECFSTAECANLCSVPIPTIYNYVTHKTNSCNGFHVEKYSNG